MTDKPHDLTLDFGDDDDVVLPSDPTFDAWIAREATSLNAPPTAPRLEMWKAIEAAQKTLADASAERVSGVHPLKRIRWFVPAAIAAALLLGIGIDRYTLRLGRPDDRAAAHTLVAAAPSDPSKLYRLAAVQTLSQAEALLTAYRAGGRAGESVAATQQLGVWGREVLSSTRLLMDSPAGDDPQLRTLLHDLELVLAQIIRLSGSPVDTTDRQLIDRAMRDHDLLPRIQTAVPAGVAGTASDD